MASRKINKVWCMFEQSGTFKREFMKLGIPAVDLDIQNNFSETDHVIDLFAEIENAWGGQSSIFDSISCDDLIMAFFPCIYFEDWKMMYYSFDPIQWVYDPDRYQKRKNWDFVIEQLEMRNKFHLLLYKLAGVTYTRGLQLIIENPWNGATFLRYAQHVWKQPDVIERDRTLRGDKFRKPTAFWFVNRTPTYGESYVSVPKKVMRVVDAKTKGGHKAGVCDEERSMIAPEYAKNFICDFILGQPNENTLPTLF